MNLSYAPSLLYPYPYAVKPECFSSEKSTKMKEKIVIQYHDGMAPLSLYLYA